MSRRHALIFMLCCLLPLLATAGCHRRPVRHLSSEVCLMVPGQMSRQEVQKLMGPPNERRVTSDGQEIWIYYDVKKSTLRKTPYIGERLGHEEFDVVTVTFAGDIVQTCVYRLLTEEEFRKAGIGAGEPSPEDQ